MEERESNKILKNREKKKKKKKSREMLGHILKAADKTKKMEVWR